MRPAPCGLATMESDNAILCRAGRVSLKQTSICVVDQAGLVGRRGRGRTPDPEAISVYVTSRAPNAGTYWPSRRDQHQRGYGPSSSDLVCRRSVSTRVMPKAVLKMQINKSDRNDAIGIARIMQTGWFKEVACQGYRQPLGQGAAGQPSAAGQDQA